MEIPRFELERWQSVWEHRVEINIAESGVLPMTSLELLQGSDSIDALLGRRLHYPSTNGSADLRERVAALYPGASAENILFTVGCAEANYLASWALADPEDPVWVMRPNYMQLEGALLSLGARLFALELDPLQGWQLLPEAIRGQAPEGSRLISVCNPNNPTGTVLSEAAIDALIDEAERIGAWILADEIYRGAELDGDETATFWGRGSRIVCTGGLSKAYGLPGLRIGWVVAPESLIERLWSHHDYTTICAAALSQDLARLALEPDTRKRILARTRELLIEGQATVADWVARHPHVLSYQPPRAGAMAWLRLVEGLNSQQLAESLLRDHSLLAIPGEQFAVPSHLRLGFGGAVQELRVGLQRVEAALRAASRGSNLHV